MFSSKVGNEVKGGRPEDMAAVKKCLDLLSEEDRMVVLAYYYDNLSVKEIARVLEISEETVKSRLFLSRKYLLTMLKEEEEKQGHKFDSPGMAMLILALDDIMNSSVEITKSDLSAKFKETCNGII